MYTRIVQHAVPTNYKVILTRQHEWRTDYPWFIRHVQGHVIADLGFMAHAFFTRVLCEYGFDVTGVDCQRPDLEQWTFERGVFRCIQGSVIEIPVADDSFDTVVAPSLLEHLGLGFYGDDLDDVAWMPALGEWHRVLRPGGMLLLQVPYGRCERTILFQNRPYDRVHTAPTLRNQLADFRVEHVSYRSLEPHGWIEVSQSVADHIDHDKPFTPCVARIAARKP